MVPPSRIGRGRAILAERGAAHLDQNVCYRHGLGALSGVGGADGAGGKGTSVQKAQRGETVVLGTGCGVKGAGQGQELRV